MKLTTYRPFAPEVWSPLERLNSLKDLFDSAFALATQLPGWQGAVWAPPLDVYETENSVIVELELAGMKKEDFDISLENDVLTISGQRTVSKEREGESLRGERFFGSFRRSFTLPVPVQADGVKATYQDGVLRVELPKAEEAKPRKIAITQG